MKARQGIAKDVADKVRAAIEEAQKHPTKKFERSTEEKDALVKAFDERVLAAEKEIAEIVRKLNATQREEVIANLSHAIKENKYSRTKAVDPTKLFDLDKLDQRSRLTLSHRNSLISTRRKASRHRNSSANQIDPLLDPKTALAALNDAISLLSTSYNTTTLENARSENQSKDSAEGQSL